jgi:hypothetical protein
VHVGAVGLALLLTGCVASEAYPTAIDNQSKNAIVVRYLRSGYSDWSASRLLPAAEAQSFAREDWVQDILRIRIQQGTRVFVLGEAQLEAIRARCNSSAVSRRLKLAPDCYIIYFGDGRLTATQEAPPGINDRLNRSLDSNSAQSSSSS